jgi:hypothetical protein
VRNEVAVHGFRIHDVRLRELLADRLARRLRVDADEHIGADPASALDDAEPDADQARDQKFP